MSNTIIPFGKYKGQPIEVLQGDPQYCEWLSGQGWLQERFPSLHTLIINNLQEPSDTPEHNALQARFLEDAILVAVVVRVAPDWVPPSLKCREGIRVDFEANGADVVLQESGPCTVTVAANCDADPRLFAALKQIKLKQLKGCVAQIQSICLPSPQDDLELQKTRDAIQSLQTANDCTVDVWTPRVFIELKPTLGDDYPAVIRQVRNLNRPGKARGILACVIGSYNGTGASFEQVRAMFSAAGIQLIRFSEIEQIAATL